MKKNRQLPAIAAAILAAGFAASAAHAGQCLPHAGGCGSNQGPVQEIQAPSARVQTFSGVDAVAPLDSNPNGQSYGHWAADWWKWVLGIPAAKNPMLDTTGEFCGQRQTGNVWFLAGFFGRGSVQRTCKVPAGKSLFFPLVNTVWVTFLNDPPKTRTDEYARKMADSYCTDYKIERVEIDGQPLEDPLRYFTGAAGSPSPLFTAQMPLGNVFNAVPDPNPPEGAYYAQELALSPNAEQGYYLFLRPLNPGNHQLKWLASSSCGPQDISYRLVVQ